MKQRLRISHPGCEWQHQQAVLGGAEGCEHARSLLTTGPIVWWEVAAQLVAVCHGTWHLGVAVQLMFMIGIGPEVMRALFGCEWIKSRYVFPLLCSPLVSD